MKIDSTKKQLVSLMKKTDFDNLSKEDAFSYMSMLSELEPEVAKSVIEQFPEFTKAIQTMMDEYKDILGRIIASDDESTKQVYDILNKKLDGAAAVRKEYIEFAEKIRLDLSRTLDNPDLTPEQKKEIIDREMELLAMIGEKDSEICEDEMEVIHIADKKDLDKKRLNWKVLTAAGLTVVASVGIGAMALGGKLNIKFPTK